MCMGIVLWPQVIPVARVFPPIKYGKEVNIPSVMSFWSRPLAQINQPIVVAAARETNLCQLQLSGPLANIRPNLKLTAFECPLRQA